MALLVNGSTAITVCVDGRRVANPVLAMDMESNLVVVATPGGGRETLYGRLSWLVDLHQCRALETQNDPTHRAREENMDQTKPGDSSASCAMDCSVEPSELPHRFTVQPVYGPCPSCAKPLQGSSPPKTMIPGPSACVTVCKNSECELYLQFYELQMIPLIPFDPSKSLRLRADGVIVRPDGSPVKQRGEPSFDDQVPQNAMDD